MIRRPPRSTLFPTRRSSDLAGILAYSSNVGTIRIGDKLGKDKIYEYQQKFGLGRATGEGMPGLLLVLVDLVLAERSEEHTSELQSHVNLVCRLLLEKKKN